jgi:MFS transporter, OPA family, glycerol-3-phosphate transporter
LAHVTGITKQSESTKRNDAAMQRPSVQPVALPPATDITGAAQLLPHKGENLVVWTLWLTYGAFYFCRTNISAAVPGLKAPLVDGGLALSGDEIGWILASLKIAYGVGQLVNGQLSERVSPRAMLALGMFGSAALNVLFGFSTGFYFLLFVWAANGFCQSLGWTPTVRVVANWVPIARRGNAIGIIGTGYQITLGLTYVIAGQAAEHLGWRGALWVPAALLTLAGVYMLAFLREAPDHRAAAADTRHQVITAPRLPVSEILYWTLYNPTLWLLGLSLGLLNACRYGFLDWGVTHLMETQDVRVGKAGLQFFVIAIGATAGSYLAGWATDRYFGSRRAPVICILMAVLGALSLMYDSVAHQSAIGTMLLLVVIGFCIYGPQVLLVGTAPADLAHRGTSAAAAGFVNFMGYMGAATGDVVTGYYSSPAHGGWQVAIYIWAAWAFAGSVITAILWNTTSRQAGLLHSAVPKLGAIATFAAACAAISYGQQPLALQIATYASAACLTATFVTRWAAAPALVVAAIGLLTVFVGYVRLHEPVAWDQSAAMVAYGLAMIAALMVLVERKEPACA